MLPIRIISMVITVGMIPGIVTYKVCFHLPAPSILAASYSSALIPEMEAI